MGEPPAQPSSTTSPPPVLFTLSCIHMRHVTTLLNPSFTHSSTPSSTPSSTHAQVARLDVDPEESRLRSELVADLAAAIRPAFFHTHRDVQLEPFGSFVSGLGTVESDVDVTITGVMQVGTL